MLYLARLALLPHTALEYANAIDARSADETALLVAWTSTGEEDVTRLASADAGDYSAKPSVARRRTGASLTDITEADNSESRGTTTAATTAALLLAPLLALPPALFGILLLAFLLTGLGFRVPGIEAADAERGQGRGKTAGSKSSQ